MREQKIDLTGVVYGKVPPQAQDAERAILGAIMLNRDAFDQAVEIIGAECFYLDTHQYIFAAFENLRSAYSPIDLITVMDQLQKNETLDKIGGPFVLTQLTRDVVSSANIDIHCKIVYQKYLQRELIRECHATAALAYEDSTDGFQLLESHSVSINNLSLRNTGKEYTTLMENVETALFQIEEIRDSKQELTGAPTGIDVLDNITQGLQPSDMIVLAARPGIGKSAVAGNIAVGAALHPLRPTKVGVFTLEMSAIQWVFRIIAAQSEIDGNDLKRGRITDNDMAYLRKEVYNKLKDAGIFFDDTASLRMSQAKAKARKMVLKEGVGLLIFDYMQLISPDDSKGNREQEVSKISRELKQLAKELMVPIICLSQFNRVADGAKPRLSNLRESGAIEQDADMVIFLIPADETGQSEDPMLKDAVMMEVAKYRNGALEPVAIRFVKRIQKIFSDENEYQRYLNRWSKIVYRDPPPGNYRPLVSTDLRPAVNSHFEVDRDEPTWTGNAID